MIMFPLFPPVQPSRIATPLRDMFIQCNSQCMSGDPQCGCWNDYIMGLFYNSPRYYNAKGDPYPIEAEY